MTDDDIKNFKELLYRMRQEDPAFRVFGSDNHQYRLGPPLSESELQAFEQTYQVTLPADFRFFLKEIGNGGAVSSSAGVPVIHAGAGKIAVYKIVQGRVTLKKHPFVSFQFLFSARRAK
jgi:hypothetical protein